MLQHCIANLEQFLYIQIQDDNWILASIAMVNEDDATTTRYSCHHRKDNKMISSAAKATIELLFPLIMMIITQTPNQTINLLVQPRLIIQLQKMMLLLLLLTIKQKLCYLLY